MTSLVNGRRTAAVLALSSILLVIPGPPATAGDINFFRVSAASQADSADHKHVTARCWPGMRLIGMGGSVGGDGHVEMDDITPREPDPLDHDPTAVRVYAYETDPTDIDWRVTAYAICATRDDLPGLVWTQTRSASTTHATRDVTVECPAPQKLVGAGGFIEGGAGEVAIWGMVPNSSLTKATVSAIELDPHEPDWTVTADAICVDPSAFDGLVRVWRSTEPEEYNRTTVTASCPEGKVVVSAAGRINHLYSHPGRWVLTAIIPRSTSVTVRASEEDASDERWSLTAFALCADG